MFCIVARQAFFRHSKQVIVYVQRLISRSSWHCEANSLFNASKVLLYLPKYSRTFSRTSYFSDAADISQSSDGGDGNISDTKNAVTYEKFEHLFDSKALKLQLKIAVREYEYLKYSGERVPNSLTEDQVKELIQKTSSSQRAKYLSYLAKNEFAAISRQKKKLAQVATREAKWQERRERLDEYSYALWYNAMYIRFSQSYINRFYNWRLANACLYGQNIVIDFGYEDVMQKRECVNAADQILLCYGFNKIDPDPFYMHFCNARPSNLVLQQFLKTCPNTHGLVNIMEQSYLDVFPKEKLVYLTPDAPCTLCEWDPDAVYIIGGFVDKTVTKPVSLAKAKREGIKVAKFPLDKYVIWKQGTKSLTIDQVFRIMLEYKNTKDWKSAFKHIPKRKLLSNDKLSLEQHLKELANRRQRTTEKFQLKGLFDLHKDEH